MFPRLAVITFIDWKRLKGKSIVKESFAQAKGWR
jgi:hypothetical protein